MSANYRRLYHQPRSPPFERRLPIHHLLSLLLPSQEKQYCLKRLFVKSNSPSSLKDNYRWFRRGSLRILGILKALPVEDREIFPGTCVTAVSGFFLGVLIQKIYNFAVILAPRH